MLAFILQSVTQLVLLNNGGNLDALHLFIILFTILQYVFFEVFASLSLSPNLFKYDCLAWSTAVLHSLLCWSTLILSSLLKP